jgi:large subunit ribosomal protein L15
MPLQRRLPKRGFTPVTKGETAEIRLDALNALTGDAVDLAALRAAGLVARNVRAAKVILAGKIARAVRLKGVGVTKGAKAAIEAAGGGIDA